MAYYDLKTNEIWAESNIDGFHDEHIEIDEVISLKKTAEKMFVEESTVKTHLKSIYQKVGCANKTELLVLAMQAKLVLPKKQEN